MRFVNYPISFLQFAHISDDIRYFAFRYFRSGWHIAIWPMVLFDALQCRAIERLVSMMSGVINVVDQGRTIFGTAGIVTMTGDATFVVIFLAFNRRGSQFGYRYSYSSVIFARSHDFGGNNRRTSYQS